VTNFEIAPPPKTVDGLLAVPIDISAIAATVQFDLATSSATADATITYTVGPTAGNPIFDLRQTVTDAWLDGASFAPSLLAHHTFGSGPFTDLRVVESVQTAGSVHTLRVLYPLTLPDAETGGAYPPALDFTPGPRVRFTLGMTDLFRARYLEAWLPANLLFDQYQIDLDLHVLNTPVAHSVITNGTATLLGTNHWQIAYPARFSAVSTLLELRATDTVEQQTGSVLLPVSGTTVTIDACKPAGSAVNLPAQIATIGTLLTANENDYGAYLHGNRFVAFFSGGGMEYEGGTTTSTGALAHETFHSWFARGVKPAGQADGWWDEAFTSFHDDGADDAIPFDYTRPPVLLCSRDPWQRHTPTNAYTDGNTFFKGLAALLGVAGLNSLMGDLYDEQKGGLPVTTQRIEEFLLSRSGNPGVVTAFHRFAYGLADPSPVPNLWLKDDPADPGADAWAGAFWDSPDLWIRTADDGGTTHQSPEFGQDNWFHARVRNKAGAGAASHFAVTFHARGFAGTQFTYPGDWLPSIAATAQFDLEPGGTRIVKARWPQALVPAAGTHTCLLASVVSRSDAPVSGRHVWEHNNLAQKNLTIVDLEPNSFIIIPVVVANLLGHPRAEFALEILGRSKDDGLTVSLVHRRKAFFPPGQEVQPFGPRPSLLDEQPPEAFELLDCGARIPGAADAAGAGPGAGAGAAGATGAVLTSDRMDLIERRFGSGWEAVLDGNGHLPVEIEPFSQTVVGLKVGVLAGGRPRRPARLSLVQRQRKTRQIVGGVSVEVTVRGRGA
jgi:hypothetical protein